MSDQEDLTARFTVTPAEVDTWQKITFKRTRIPSFQTGSKWVFFGLYLAIPFFFGSLNPPRGRPAALPSAIGEAVTLFVAVQIYCWFSEQNTVDIAIRKRSAEGEFSYLLSHRAMTLQKQGIQVDSETSTEVYSWQKVRKISFTTNGMILFAFDADKACIIPGTAFTTVIAAHTFYERVMCEYEANRSVTRSYSVSTNNIRPRL